MPPLLPIVQRLLRPFAYLLYGIAILFLLKSAGRLWSQHRFENKVEASVAALSQKETDEPTVLKDVLAEQKKRADTFSKNNYFYPKPVPPLHLTTIFSEEALIDGNWKKIGDRVNDAIIKAITSVSVTLETDGNERILYLDGYSAASADQAWIQNQPTSPSLFPETANETP
jgi:hypothetical protein